MHVHPLKTGFCCSIVHGVKVLESGVLSRHGAGSAMAGSCTPIPVSAPDPNHPQRGSLPVSLRVILEAIHAGLVLVWGGDDSLLC